MNGAAIMQPVVGRWGDFISNPIRRPSADGRRRLRAAEILRSGAAHGTQTWFVVAQNDRGALGRQLRDGDAVAAGAGWGGGVGADEGVLR